MPIQSVLTISHKDRKGIISVSSLIDVTKGKKQDINFSDGTYIEQIIQDNGEICIHTNGICKIQKYGNDIEITIVKEDLDDVCFDKDQEEYIDKLNNIEMGVISAELKGSKGGSDYFIIHNGFIKLISDGVYHQYFNKKNIEKVKSLIRLQFQANESQIWSTIERFISLIDKEKLNEIEIYWSI